VTGQGVDIPPRLSERAFQRQVIEFAQLHSWRVAHFRPGQTAHGFRTAVEGDGAGFPDLVLARAGELIFAELKTETGRVSPAQQGWLDELDGQGREVYLWRPAMWPEIERRLGWRAA
jgi:hypothetical protein